MKYEFVKTANATAFKAGVAACRASGSRDSRLMTVSGRPGEGKTATLMNWAAEANAVILTGKVDWTTRRMMVDLSRKVGIVHEGVSDLGYAVGEYIAQRKISIIVDEAGYALDNGAKCLDKLREFTDAIPDIMMVMVFMTKDFPRLNHPRLSLLTSRISERCEFKHGTLEDIALVCRQLSEVPIAPDLVAHIHHISEGNMREVLKAISRVEGQASLRPGDQCQAPMSMASIKGLDLFKDLIVHRNKRGV